MTLFIPCIQFVTMHSDSIPKFSMKVGQPPYWILHWGLVDSIARVGIFVCAQLMLIPPCKPGVI